MENNEKPAEQPASSDKHDAQQPLNTKQHKIIFAALSYLGPLVLVSLAVKKDDPFVKFHIKQGLVLLAIQVILWVLSSSIMLWSLWPLYKIIHLGLFILVIIGIINVTQDKEKELPLVGGFAKHFPI